MTGQEFERLVLEKMEAFGWDCRITPSSNDYGADLVCTLGEQTLVVQCKCYADSGYVGLGAIQEVYGAIAYYQADEGIVVFRGRMSNQCRRLAQTTNVGVFHVDAIVQGWKFDKTLEGATHRAEVAREEAENARIRAVEQDRAEQELSRAKTALWHIAVRRQKQWMAKGFAAVFVAVFCWGQPHGLSFVAFVAVFVAGYGIFLTSPGPMPPAMGGVSEKCRLS